jgi:hypothetical protein
MVMMELIRGMKGILSVPALLLHERLLAAKPNQRHGSTA